MCGHDDLEKNRPVVSHGTFDAARFLVYACRECGYSEFYKKKFAIKKKKEKKKPKPKKVSHFGFTKED